MKVIIYLVLRKSCLKQSRKSFFMYMMGCQMVECHDLLHLHNNLCMMAMFFPCCLKFPTSVTRDHRRSFFLYHGAMAYFSNFTRL